MSAGPRTVRGAALLELQRSILAQLGELEHTEPADVALVVGAIVSHLRAWHPEAVTPLGVLPAPTEAIRDPRSQ